jgi:hypothetical protein
VHGGSEGLCVNGGVWALVADQVSVGSRVRGLCAWGEWALVCIRECGLWAMPGVSTLCMGKCGLWCARKWALVGCVCSCCA